MVTKRGQAAMEFLMTYGWALLVVLVAIGALAFFGVLNPGQFLPSSCNLFPGLGCTDFKVDNVATDTVTMVLQNGLGEDMNIVGITIVGDGVSCVGKSAAVGGITFESGQATCTVFDTACKLSDGKKATVKIACSDFPATAGSKFRSSVTISYKSGTSGISHTKNGQIVTSVE